MTIIVFLNLGDSKQALYRGIVNRDIVLDKRSEGYSRIIGEKTKTCGHAPSRTIY